jgi:4-oxalocrotonate tautomerase
MPLVQVKVIEGVFSEAQKKKMIKKITDAMVSIEGENLRQVTFVIVEEVKSGDGGSAEKPWRRPTLRHSRQGNSNAGKAREK